MATYFFRHTILNLFNLVIILSFAFIVFNNNFCYAADNIPIGIDQAFNTNQANSPLKVAAETGAGYNSTATFESIIGQIVTTVLGLIGIVFLILAIYGGYNWMTASGNEQMVEKAKKTITDAVIGLILVLAAYVISWFLVNAIGLKVFK